MVTNNNACRVILYFLCSSVHFFYAHPAYVHIFLATTVKVLTGSRMPDLPSGEGNSQFDGDLTQTIRLPINTTRTLQSQHHFSFGYQLCTAELTSLKRLSPTCEPRTQARAQEKTTQFAENLE